MSLVSFTHYLLIFLIHFVYFLHIFAKTDCPILVLKSCHFFMGIMFDPSASCEFSFSCHRRRQNWWSPEQHGREVIGGSVAHKDVVKAAGNRGLCAFCVESTLQSLLVWVELHGVAAGEENVLLRASKWRKRLSLFKGMFHIPSYKVTSYTGQTSPMLFNTCGVGL